MFGRDFAVKAPLAHGCGVLSDAKTQYAGCIPDFDLFHHGAGGEFADAGGARACPFDAGLRCVLDAVKWRVNFVKTAVNLEIGTKNCPDGRSIANLTL